MLSIVETLKEFRTILLGQKIIVYTDHKNLICNDLQTDRVLRWRLLLEDVDIRYIKGVSNVYIKGVSNVVADVLSRYPTNNDPLKESQPPTREHMSKTFSSEKLDGDNFPPKLSLIAHYQQKTQSYNNS